MTLTYDAARANLYHLWQQHPNWQHAELAAALGSSQEWVKKWLKRLREELAGSVPLEQVLQGPSRARKSPPAKTHALVVEQILAIRDQPPEGLRRVPAPEAIHDYLEREPLLQMFQLPIPSCKTMYRVLKTHESSAITPAITRSVWPSITPPPWSKPKRSPRPSSRTTTSSARIRASRVATAPRAARFPSCPPYPPNL